MREFECAAYSDREERWMERRGGSTTTTSFPLSKTGKKQVSSSPWPKSEESRVD